MQQPKHHQATGDRTGPSAAVAANTERARQQARWHAGGERAQAWRVADLRRRQRAAGIDPDAGLPDGIEALRLGLARQILMWINDWHGCELRFCRRMHGCMAPDAVCANHAGEPPIAPAEWDRVRVEVRRALDRMIEANGGRDAIEARLAAEAADKRKETA